MPDVGGPVLGTAGNDVLMGDARDLVTVYDNYVNEIDGGAGDDIIVGDLFSPESYNTEPDGLHGGRGNDVIYGDTAPDLSVLGVISAFDGDPDWNTRLEGSSDKLYGDAGNDELYGCGGSDSLYGGTGRDRLYGGNGFDWLEGGDGADRIWAGADDDTVYGGKGADLIWGGGGNDALYGEDFSTSDGDGGDIIRGGTGNDDIRGGAGADRLFGNAGDDRIEGGGLWSDASNDLGDFCVGGGGNDTISGGFGSDRIVGGKGRDIITGGDGRDFFIYRSVAESTVAEPDQLLGFNEFGRDRIDLRKIDAIAGGTDDAFAFVGSGPFTAAGQVRVYQDAGNMIVDINTGGTLDADMRIQLNGLVDVVAGNFLF